MKNMAHKALLSAISLGVSLPALGQASDVRSRPAVADQFSLPTVSGSLSYSLTAAERLAFGYTGLGGTDSATTLAGDVAFLSPSVARPFSLVYAGGYLVSTSQQPSSFFHHLTASQVVNTKNWVFLLGDDVSYLPQTATTGRSGIAGVGDAGSQFSSGPQNVLTRFATRVDNLASGSASRKVTGSTQINGAATYSIDRFLNAPTALESNQQSYGGGVTHRIDARNSVDVTYTYGRFTYLGYAGNFSTQGLSAQYVRQVSRKFKVDVSAGPQRIDSSSLTQTPPSLSYTANLNLTYTGEILTGGGSYSRSTNSGSGVTLGATTDTVRATAARPLTRFTLVSGSLSYAHTASLSRATLNPFSTQALLAGVQANRTIRTNFSAYVSYTLERQTVSGLDLTGLSTSGVSHILGFGITYSPKMLRLAGN